MQTILLITVLIMSVFVLRLVMKLNRLEEKTRGAFRVICTEVRMNKEKMNAFISQFSHEEEAE